MPSDPRTILNPLAIPRVTVPEELRTPVTFAYITSWRIDSEVLSLEWRQVDFVAEEVRLDPGKTKNREGRMFPFTRELREVLERQRAATEDVQSRLGIVCARVFHRSGKPIKTFRIAFRSACVAARRRHGGEAFVEHVLETLVTFASDSLHGHLGRLSSAQCPTISDPRWSAIGLRCPWHAALTIHNAPRRCHPSQGWRR